MVANVRGLASTAAERQCSVSADKHAAVGRGALGALVKRQQKIEMFFDRQIFKGRELATLLWLSFFQGGLFATPAISTSPVLWLDGSDVNGDGTSDSSTGIVSTWVDKSPDGNDLSATANQPSSVHSEADTLRVLFHGLLAQRTRSCWNHQTAKRSTPVDRLR